MKRTQPKRRGVKIPGGKADAPKPADPFNIDFAEIIGVVLGGGRIPKGRIPELEREGDLSFVWAFRADIKTILKLVSARRMADLPEDA